MGRLPRCTIAAAAVHRFSGTHASPARSACTIPPGIFSAGTGISARFLVSLLLRVKSVSREQAGQVHKENQKEASADLAAGRGKLYTKQQGEDAMQYLGIMIIGWRNQSRIRLISLPNDKFCNEYMAKQQGCFAAQQSCAAKSFFAFRHHIIIIEYTVKNKPELDPGFLPLGVWAAASLPEG